MKNYRKLTQGKTKSQKDHLSEVIGIIITFGFITGLSWGIGVKIPSEGDVLLIVYDAVNQSFSTVAHGNSPFYSSFSDYGSIIQLLVLVLEIIPIICALVLLPWGPVLLADTIVAGYSLGIFALNNNQTMMWIGLIALLFFPVFCRLIIESKKTTRASTG
jgi:hypothetical protein